MDDLISRKAVLELPRNITRNFFGEIVEESIDVERIKTLPSARPERRWIPVKTRPMDEEEKQYYEEHYGYKVGVDYDGFMFDCPMPDDGQEVWVCFKSGNVEQDICEIDEGIGLEGNGDWDGIVAWMPFERPKPWGGEANE